MQVSVASFVVLFGLLMLGRSLGSALIVGLVASCAFGSTAIATVTALGGSSPLLYNVFGAAIIISAIASRTAARDLAAVFNRTWVPWVVTGLILYACGSAVIMPRLFSDQTSTFSVSSTTGFVEVALSPTSGNLLQTSYLVLFALTFVALSMLSTRTDATRAMCRGFFAWAAIVAAGGILDVGAKSAGLGDVLEIVRTANYAFLTNAEESGFSRINGTFSEASAFAGTALGALAFTYTYWRGCRSPGALILTVCLLLLLVFSTSSTAYIGLLILMVPFCLGTAWSLARGRDSWNTGVTLWLLVLLVSLALILLVARPEYLDSADRLIRSTLIDKANSESAVERSYMNQISVQNVLDTWGLGVGYGSSRSSSWFLAVLSQLGVIGSVLQLLLLAPFMRGMKNSARWGEAPPNVAVLHDSLQACALALFVGQTISGTNANPGILFFTALAGVGACRAQMAANPLQSEQHKYDIAVAMRGAEPQIT